MNVRIPPRKPEGGNTTRQFKSNKSVFSSLSAFRGFRLRQRNRKASTEDRTGKSKQSVTPSGCSFFPSLVEAECTCTRYQTHKATKEITTSRVPATSFDEACSQTCHESTLCTQTSRVCESYISKILCPPRNDVHSSEEQNLLYALAIIAFASLAHGIDSCIPPRIGAQAIHIQRSKARHFKYICI